MSLTKAASLGALSGMRSIPALAVVSDAAEDHKDAGLNHIARDILAAPRVAALLKAMAVGEMMMDKMPFIPARTKLVPLMGRAVMGAAVGAAVMPRASWLGGGIGALSAVGAAHLAYMTRKALHEKYEIPDGLLGVVEDAAVVSAAHLIVHNTQS